MREANREAVILFSDLDGTFADPDVRTVMESAEAAITPVRSPASPPVARVLPAHHRAGDFEPGSAAVTHFERRA